MAAICLPLMATSALNLALPVPSEDQPALEYAREHGIDAIVQEPHKRKPNVRAGGYGENFATNRRSVWTH